MWVRNTTAGTAGFAPGVWIEVVSSSRKERKSKMTRKKENKETLPQESTEDILESLILAYEPYPKELFGNEEVLLATAGEDYLHDYGIHKGDKVIFRRQDHADYGQIVCALVGRDLCIRRYLFDADKGLPYIKSANPDVEDVYEFNVVGVAAWILRQFNNPGNKEVLAS